MPTKVNAAMTEGVIKDTDKALSTGSSLTAQTGKVVQLGTNNTVADTINPLYTLGGIQLGGSGAANLLESYEEGTWTLGDGSGGSVTFAQEDGFYIKIGRQVSAYGFVNFPTTSHSGAVRIIGLPFTLANADSARGGGSISFQNVTTSSMEVIGVKNTQQIEFFSGGGNAFQNNDFSTKSVYFAIHYYTA